MQNKALVLFIIMLLGVLSFVLFKVVNVTELTKCSPEMANIVSGEAKIPKRIIQVWKTWSSKTPEMFANYTKSIRQLNPEYEYIMFKDEDIDIFLKTNYPDYYKTYLSLPMNIQKVDFARYVLIYHYGGFYFDLDVLGQQPLDNLLHNEIVFPIDEIIDGNMCNLKRFAPFCQRGYYFLLGQYGFAAMPRHPFIKELIEGIHANLNTYIRRVNFGSNEYVYQTTGPDFVTSKYLDYSNQKDIVILYNGKRQCFGDYAKHYYVGTWKGE